MTKTKPMETNGSLTKNEIKVLKVLAKGKAALTRVQLSKRTGINGGWSKLLGAGNYEGYGVQGGGLALRGLLLIEGEEDSRILSYTITAKGRKAIAKY